MVDLHSVGTLERAGDTTLRPDIAPTGTQSSRLHFSVTFNFD